jgi:hypothetical protein
MTTSVKVALVKSSLTTSGSPGVGDALQRLKGSLQDAVEPLFSSVSLGKSLRERLYQILEECGHPNWDGYSAQPVSFEAYENAKRFVQGLPLSFPAPEVAAEPEFEIAFEWYGSPTRVFSVSVGASDELNYAGLFGASRTYGTEVFYDEIPEVILWHITRIYS